MLSDEAVWGPQVEAFAGEAQVQVARYGQARTLAAMAQALLDQAPPRFALAAHSLGGPRRHGGRALGARTADGPVPDQRRHPAQAHRRGWRGGDPGPLRSSGLARDQGMDALAERFTPVLLHPDRMTDPALVQTVMAMVARQTADKMEREIEAGEGRPDHAEALRALKVPALLICGVEDSFGRGPLQAAMAALLPGAPTLLIERCGHLPMLETPSAVNKAMHDWFARVRDTFRAPAAIC
ncbi:MAG: alpha/beta hydrolase [Caulobacteraceae bacterium]